jgi:plastocyanin
MKTVKAHQRILAVLALCFALAVLLAACGGDDSSSGSSNTTASGSSNTTAAASGSNSSSAAVAVTIDNFAFSVKPVTAGQSFKVQNKDGTEHTFTANNGAFDVDVPAGKTVTVDGQKAGTYAFHCKIHSFMTGTLKVS